MLGIELPLLELGSLKQILGPIPAARQQQCQTERIEQFAHKYDPSF